MLNPTTRKLKLNKETVRLLSDEALRFAVGGTTSATMNPFCTNGTCASVGCPPDTGTTRYGTTDGTDTVCG